MASNGAGASSRQQDQALDVKLKVNLLAPTLCSKLAISHMCDDVKEPRGHILNVLSVWGCEVPRREYTHFYSATKHALKAVSEGLRIELAARKLPIKVEEIDWICCCNLS